MTACDRATELLLLGSLPTGALRGAAGRLRRDACRPAAIIAVALLVATALAGVAEAGGAARIFTQGVDEGLRSKPSTLYYGSDPFVVGVKFHATRLVWRRCGYLCMHAAFCVGRQRKIPAMMTDTVDSDVRAQVIGMIDRCPSGSYTYALKRDGDDIEPDLPIAIALTADDGALAGPLWITGGIPVQRADGEPFETRNRVTLCRCGHSKIKPLCDGTHRTIDFRE